MENSSLTFTNNFVYSKNSRIFKQNITNKDYLIDNNTYYNQTHDPLQFGGTGFEKWQKKGYDTHSNIINIPYKNVTIINLTSNFMNDL